MSVLRPRDWLRYLWHRPAHAALLAAMVLVLATMAWVGVERYRLEQRRAAAKEVLARYDFPAARRHLALCLASRPGDPELLLLAAQAARRDGLLDEAEEHLTRHTKRAGTTPEEALQWVLVQVQRGQVKEHVQSLIEQIEVRHPQTEQILESLAQGSVHAYHLRESDFWTRQLLTRFPDNPVGLLLDAQAGEIMGRRQQALDTLRRLVEERPDFDKGRAALADLLHKLRRHEEAAEQYRELHRRQPDDAGHLLGLVRSLVALERLDETRPLLRELQERHGDNSEALLECARAALREGRPADAEPLLRRAEKLAPYDPHVQSGLATCLKQLDRHEESDRHLRRFRQIEADAVLMEKAFAETVTRPNDPNPRRLAGEICLRNGQVPEGLRWLYGVLDLAPNDRRTHQLLADHFTAQGEEELARSHRARAR